jgi:hypothetical protein
MQKPIKSPKFEIKFKRKDWKFKCLCDPDGSVQKLGEFYEVDLGLDPKTSFNPYDMFSHKKSSWYQKQLFQISKHS